MLVKSCDRRLVSTLPPLLGARRVDVREAEMSSSRPTPQAVITRALHSWMGLLRLPAAVGARTRRARSWINASSISTKAE